MILCDIINNSRGPISHFLWWAYFLSLTSRFCTRWRDGILGADAWEHHRAIVALVEDLWHPGNPTYATTDTSIRFSPYTVIQALICRTTGLAPYDVLSGAAVLNTLLLVAGVWLLLRQFGEEASAAAVLLVMVGLYGDTPGICQLIRPRRFTLASGQPFSVRLRHHAECLGTFSPRWTYSSRHAGL